MNRIFLTYALLIPGVLTAADQWSKWWITRRLNKPMNICEQDLRPGVGIEVSPLFDFSLVCNPGISWGLLQGDSSVKRWLLTLFAFIMCGVLIYSLTRVKDRLNRLSIALILGGAIGNGIDRLLYGAVTDFIDFGDIGFHWVFNIADSAITMGVIGLLIASFVIKPDENTV